MEWLQSYIKKNGTFKSLLLTRVYNLSLMLSISYIVFDKLFSISDTHGKKKLESRPTVKLNYNQRE